VRFRGVSDARSVHVTIVISRIVLRGVRAQAGRQARPSWRERDTGAARAINPRDRSGPGPTEPAITQTVHDLVGAASKLSHDRQTDTGRQSECDGDRTFAPIPDTCPQQSTIAGIRLTEDNGSWVKLVNESIWVILVSTCEAVTH